MFNTGTHSVKNAGRYFEQFVKVAHPKTSTKQVKALPASLYTSPKSKYNSNNNNGNSKKNWIIYVYLQKMNYISSPNFVLFVSFK